MFKLKPSILLSTLILLFTIIPQSTTIILDYFTYCIGSCYNCPTSPYQCSYVQSLLYPPANYNCLPYTTGDTCTDNAYGYQVINQDGLDGWTNSNNNVVLANTYTDCTIYHQPPTTPKFKILGPFIGGTNITKTIQVNRDTIQVIILKLSFAINTANTFANATTTNSQSTTNNNNNNDANLQDQPNINPDGTVDPVTTQASGQTSSSNRVSNKTNRSFVDIKVTGPGVNYLLQLNYPTIPNDKTKIINSTCGLHVQYVSSYALKVPVPANALNIKFNILSYGDPNATDATWGLSKFQVNVGCGGMIIPNGTQLCGTCMNGFYPLIAQQGIIMGCAPCPINCKTCTQDRCTLCQSNTFFNSATSTCQLNSLYINIPNYQILQGTSITNLTSQNYLYNVIMSQNTANSITLQTQLKSASPFSIKFYIIYTKQFVSLLKDRVVIIKQNQQNIMNITAQQFRNQIGLYDQRLREGIVRHYVKSIYIDKLQQQNLNKLLQITIQAPLDVRNYYISNYIVTQYQCAARCQQCDRATNNCLQCSNFFLRGDGQTCKNCPNGFYLKKTYDNRVSNYSLTKLQQDICVKCHSTCKQCIGPQQGDCNQCFKLFYLDSIQYNKQCVSCAYNVWKKQQNTSPICQRCSQGYRFQSVVLITNCIECLNRKPDQILIGQVCHQCWLASGLASGRCLPTPASGLNFYGADSSNGVVDKSSWTQVNATGPLQNLNCTIDYQYLWGIPNTNNQNNVTLRWNSQNLPSHIGLYIIFNIFKTDIKITTINNDNQRKSQNIYIKIDNKITTIQLINRRDGNTVVPGANICSDINNQMIQTFSYDSPTHKQSSINIQVTSQGGGIYIRQLQLYLGNCPNCAKNQLNYQIKYLPRYSYNSTTNTGIDIWIQFNQPVQIADNNTLKQVFKFNINQQPNLKLQPTQFINDLLLNNRLKYYIPLDQSFGNSTLNVKTNGNTKIYGVGNNKLQISRRLLINNPLNIISSQQILHRYSKLSADDLVSTSQIYEFFNFFQWFSLIVMIICIFLGIGVVFQQFSILLQLLFLHVYISSMVLPATFKAPLDGLQRMENLNYFADPHAQSIQWQWFKNYQHPSPYVFQQYNKDILFERSFYPTIIINLMYLVWFIILFVIYKCNQRFERTKNPILGFFRNIPARPLNFIDQIWRYQFITTIWSAFMQFHILKNDTAWERLNLALCFISFIISVVWPIFVVIYTYHLNLYKYTTDFLYKYQDIYYLKFKTMSQSNIKYYYYILIRFARYLIMALFISVFTQHEIIAPVILICANLIQAIYVVSLHIYQSSAICTVFKVLQNLLFIGVEVSLLFAYALSDTANDSDFLNLGYAINVLYVIMIIIGILRFAYLLYRKLKNIPIKKKMGKDDGEVVKVQPMPLPNTDRGDGQAPNNLMP